MFVSPKLLWKRSSGDGVWGLSISTDIYQSTSGMVSVCTTNQPTNQPCRQKKPSMSYKHEVTQMS